MAIRKSSTSGVPFGNTANRPANPQVGQTYYNGELGYQEIYTTAGWIPASGGNDFNLNLGGTYTAVTFTQSYGSGAYSVVSSNNDTTLDIYAYAADGSLAGYSSTKSFNATQRFNKMVIVGGQQGDVLTFSYKTTFATTNTTSEITAGPFITAVSPSAMPNINNTVTITGGNFANNVQVAFTGSGYSSTPAKNIVRSSSSSLIVTRPDNFPISASPYTITVTNPGVSAPVGSSSHISSNSVTAGTTPVWNTSANLPTFTRNIAYSTVLSATDPDTGGSITYSLVSGSLPTGLSLSSLTGGISGTPTSSALATFTVRATDAGGNYVDRAFTLPNAVPVWSTTSQTLSGVTNSTAVNLTLVATDDSGNTPTYSIISGSLPSGISLNTSTGVLSGTPTVTTSNSVTFAATDVNGSTVSGPTITFNFRTAGTFTLSSLPSFYIPGDIINISYTGAEQTFSKLNATSCDIELWGASGRAGDGTRGGGGGYVKGRLSTSQSNYYLHIGGYGTQAETTAGTTGGYNGGGSFRDTGNNGWILGSGGGASDIRLTSGSWNDATGLNNRILVAGGGGGGNRNGGNGSGGVGAYPNGTQSSDSNGGGGSNGTGGTQSSGGSSGGGFGFGGSYNGAGNILGGPGGGGWYGGGYGGYHMGLGGGGSSYYNSSYISNFSHSNGSAFAGLSHGSAKITVIATS